MESTRRTPRLPAILPLKVLLGDDPQTHFSHTMDISATGVKIMLPFPLEEGSEVVLEYKKNHARAVVMWSRPMKRNSRDHAIGLRLLDDGQRFWLVELAPKMHILASSGQADSARTLKKSGTAD